MLYRLSIAIVEHECRFTILDWHKHLEGRPYFGFVFIPVSKSGQYSQHDHLDDIFKLKRTPHIHVDLPGIKTLLDYECRACLAYTTSVNEMENSNFKVWLSGLNKTVLNS